MSRERNVTQIFTQLSNNYHKQLAFTWGLRGLIVGFSGIILWFFINRFTGIELVKGSYLLIVSICLPVTCYLGGYYWPVSLKIIVKKADRKANFKERLLTLYEYLENKSDNPFLDFLKHDVTNIFDLLKERKIFPRKWMPEAGIIVVLVIFLSIFIFWEDSTLIPGINYPFPGPVNVEEQSSGLFQEESNNEVQQQGQEQLTAEEQLSPGGQEKTSSETDNNQELSTLTEQENDNYSNQGELDSQQRSSLEDRLNASTEQQDTVQTEQTEQGQEETGVSENKSGTTSTVEKDSSDKQQLAQKTEEMSAEEKEKSVDSANIEQQNNKEDQGQEKQNQTTQNQKTQTTQTDEQSSPETNSEEFPQQTEDNKDSTGGEETNNVNMTTSSEQTPADESQSSKTQNQQQQVDQGNNDKVDNGSENQQSTAGGEPGTTLQEQETQTADSSQENSSYYLNKVKSQLNNNQYLTEYLRELALPEINGESGQLSEKRIIEYREQLLNQFKNEDIPVLYRDLIKDYFQNIIEADK